MSLSGEHPLPGAARYSQLNWTNNITSWPCPMGRPCPLAESSQWAPVHRHIPVLRRHTAAGPTSAPRTGPHIGWDKAYRGYLSLTCGLLETPHDVPNPYNKNPQPSAWAISTLSKLGNFSKAMCGKPAARNSMIPITPLLQQSILMQRSLIAMPTPEIFSLPRDRQLLHINLYLESPQIQTLCEYQISSRHIIRHARLSPLHY